MTEIFCRHCGEKQIFSKEIEYENIICSFCREIMVSKTELLINLNIDKEPTIKQCQVSTCKCYSQINANYCFKCGYPYTNRGENDLYLNEKKYDKYKILNIGDILMDRYEVKEVLPKGLSVAYIAYDLQKKETIRIVFSLYSDYTLMFKKASKIWIKIPPHKNVLKAYSINEFNNIPFLFLEYIHGKDLSQIIGNNQIDIQLIIAIAIQICDGMEHIWNTMKSVHRDLKPSNIIIGEDGFVRIADLELLIVINEKDDKTSNTICGTAIYMSPEQWSGQNIDNRSDIYSFGIILYEMICGIHPFNINKENIQSNLESISQRCLNNIPQPPQKYRQDCPILLNYLILKCLEKKPENRFGNFKEIKESLLEIQYALISKCKNNKNLQDPLIEGVSLFHAQKYNEALQLFERATEIYPENAVLWLNLAFTYLNVERPLNIIIKCFRKANKKYYSTDKNTLSVSKLSSQFIIGCWYDVRIDIDRRLIWIQGDFGITIMDYNKYYTPYDYFGNPIEPGLFPEFDEKWWRYNDNSQYPWLVPIKDTNKIGISCLNLTDL